MRVPNAHGVYEPSETLVLPNPRPGWRGCPLADIDLLELPDGWRSSIGAQLANRGRAEPITLSNPCFPTREAALRHAIERLRVWLAASGEAQAPLVIRWLDALIPDQPDLFGEAA